MENVTTNLAKRNWPGHVIDTQNNRMDRESFILMTHEKRIGNPKKD